MRLKCFYRNNSEEIWKLKRLFHRKMHFYINVFCGFALESLGCSTLQRLLSIHYQFGCCQSDHLVSLNPKDGNQFVNGNDTNPKQENLTFIQSKSTYFRKHMSFIQLEYSRSLKKPSFAAPE